MSRLGSVYSAIQASPLVSGRPTSACGRLLRVPDHFGRPACPYACPTKRPTVPSPGSPYARPCRHADAPWPGWPMQACGCPVAWGCPTKRADAPWPGWPNQACERPNQTWTGFGLRFLGSLGLSPEMAPAFVAGPLKHPVAPSLLWSPGLPVSYGRWPGMKPQKCPLYFL